MNQSYPDPGDPEVVAAILKHQKSLTREQWQDRLARIPGLVTEYPLDNALPEEDSKQPPATQLASILSTPRRVKGRPVKTLHK